MAKRVPAEGKDQPLGQQLAKIRVMMPLFKGMQVRPNLRRLICRKANLLALKAGDTVKLARGTRVVDVSPA